MDRIGMLVGQMRVNSEACAGCCRSSPQSKLSCRVQQCHTEVWDINRLFKREALPPFFLSLLFYFLTIFMPLLFSFFSFPPSFLPDELHGGCSILRLQRLLPVNRGKPAMTSSCQISSLPSNQALIYPSIALPSVMCLSSIRLLHN